MLTLPIPQTGVQTELNEEGLTFYNSLEPPFRIYGLDPTADEAFRRLNSETAAATSESVYHLSRQTSGLRLRFKTNSPYVAIQAHYSFVQRFSHMPLLGTAGFDLYLNRDGHSRYINSFMPPVELVDQYEQIIYLGSAEERDLTINFPLYAAVTGLYIGVDEGAEIRTADPYHFEKPVVYYGSSITHGACASRPGNAYPSLISRALDTNFINLGFSGAAKAEEAIADHISNLDMSVFVYDYDHNAPTPAYLEETHEPLFLKLREKQADLPVIFVSRPDFYLEKPEDLLRRDIIYRTYHNALTAGDRNVYFIDGSQLFNGAFADDCTVDTCHPNDLGFFRMAEVIGAMVKHCLLI